MGGVDLRDFRNFAGLYGIESTDMTSTVTNRGICGIEKALAFCYSNRDILAF